MHVLLVEDHPDTRSILARLLRQWGHDVAEAGTMRVALSLLNNIRFDILLSDIGLPDGDGLVAEAMRLGSARVKVALTAFATAQDRERGLQAGFDYYLTKPCDAARLKMMIVGPS